MKQLSKKQFLALLSDEIEAEGSQKAFAEKNSLSESYLSDVLRNRREPGEKILRTLRMRAVTNYVPTKEKE